MRTDEERCTCWNPTAREHQIDCKMRKRQEAAMRQDRLERTLLSERDPRVTITETRW